MFEFNNHNTIVDIPTNKGATSWKIQLSKLGNWMFVCVIQTW